METPLIRCPHCQILKTIEETSLSFKTIRNRYPPSHPFNYLQAALDGTFHDWACRDCLDSGKVIAARIALQDNQGPDAFPWAPVFIYSDQIRHCVRCQQHFTFTAAEQQYWYETIQIPTAYSPKMCAACRKESRRIKNINKSLSVQLKVLKERPSLKSLRIVIQAYELLGNKSKAGFYQQQLSSTKKTLEKQLQTLLEKGYDLKDEAALQAIWQAYSDLDMEEDKHAKIIKQQLLRLKK